MRGRADGISISMLPLLIGVISLAKGKSLNSPSLVVVKVTTEHAVRTTSDKFLSITLDHTWLSLASIGFPKIVNLARELSPAYLRVGGTAQDFLHWKKSGKEKNCFNATQVGWLHDFVKAAELDLIFGLAPLPREKNGTWDPQNAIQFLDYVEENDYIMRWELGNEPDQWPSHNITNITAEQLAKDHGYLRNVLKRYRKENTMLFGPDVAALHSDHDFFERYLESLDNGILDAVTYHQYYEDSDGAKLDDFINITILDGFISYGQKAVSLVHSTQGANTPVWLGETSSTYNSGAKGLSDSYVAGFMWLDKLGVAALINHTVVCRQSIVGGYYSLLERETLYPLPDYWTSVLHKTLVGEKVLMVENSLEPGRKARIYAHCTKTKDNSPYEAGAITLIVLNLYPNETLSIELEEDLKKLNVDQFLLQPGTESITSQSVKLNGKILKLLEHNQLPELNPENVTQPFTVPPLTYGYFVIPQANAKACSSKNAFKLGIKV